jgi:plastocyanin
LTTSTAEEGLSVRRISLPLTVLLTLAAVLLPGSARSASTATALKGTVGPGFSITLKDAGGTRVTHLDPGAYSITVDDLAAIHNFHLTGPGSVDMATDLEKTETVTWNVTLVDGTYKYRCDAHATMNGSFQVGAATPPPAVQKLSGRVGPGKTIALKKGATLVKGLTAGSYKIAVRDSTRKDNFHLLGPGVSKRTGVKSRGAATWKVTLRAGVYTYRSDAHPKTLRRKFKVLKTPSPA